MLVISRKEGQVIKIGENTRIYILKTTNGQVRIGIDAPKGVKVLRGELVSDAKPKVFTVGQRVINLALEPCEIIGDRNAEGFYRVMFDDAEIDLLHEGDLVSEEPNQ